MRLLQSKAPAVEYHRLIASKRDRFRSLCRSFRLVGFVSSALETIALLRYFFQNCGWLHDDSTIHDYVGPNTRRSNSNSRMFSQTTLLDSSFSFNFLRMTPSLYNPYIYVIFNSFFYFSIDLFSTRKKKKLKIHFLTESLPFLFIHTVKHPLTVHTYSANSAITLSNSRLERLV